MTTRIIRLLGIATFGLSFGVATNVFAQSNEVQIPDGTRVTVRLLQQISSETSKQGDSVNFEVAADVKLDGHVVVSQGTPARGTIVEAEPKRRMGRAGKLVFAVTDTKGVDGRTIRLRSANSKEGESHVTGVVVTTTVVAAFVPVAAPFMLLRHGKDIGSPEGARFDAFVDGDHRLVAQTTLHPIPRDPTPRDQTVTTLHNDDVMDMHRAGLGDSVIIAKIENSPGDYTVTAQTLIQLKKAGISDRVLAAMVAASGTK